MRTVINEHDAKITVHLNVTAGFAGEPSHELLSIFNLQHSQRNVNTDVRCSLHLTKICRESRGLLPDWTTQIRKNSTHTHGE